MHHHPRLTLPCLLTSLCGLLAAACEASGPETEPRLTVSILGSPPPAAIRITSAQLVLTGIGLSQAGTCCDALARDPLLVELPVGAVAPRKVLDAAVRGATYTRVRAGLDAVASLPAHPAWPAGTSVRVVGVYTDPGGGTHDFTFTSSVEAQIEMPFTEPVTVAARPRNVTVRVDLARWFADPNGAPVDPANGANAATISASIQGSFAAFEDDDEDGMDDEDPEDDDADDPEDDDDPDDDEADDDQDDDDQDDDDGDDPDDSPTPPLRR